MKERSNIKSADLHELRVVRFETTEQTPPTESLRIAKDFTLKLNGSEITQLTENPFFPPFPLNLHTHNRNTSQFRAGFCKCCLNCHQRSVTAVVQSPFIAAVSVFEQSTVSAA